MVTEQGLSGKFQRVLFLAEAQARALELDDLDAFQTLMEQRESALRELAAATADGVPEDMVEEVCSLLAQVQRQDAVNLRRLEAALARTRDQLAEIRRGLGALASYKRAAASPAWQFQAEA